MAEQQTGAKVENVCMRLPGTANEMTDSYDYRVTANPNHPTNVYHRLA